MRHVLMIVFAVVAALGGGYFLLMLGRADEFMGTYIGVPVFVIGALGLLFAWNWRAGLVALALVCAVSGLVYLAIRTAH